MAKYIIEIEDEPVNGLYKAKNFNTLVFDAEGLKRLDRYQEPEIYYYITDRAEIKIALDTASPEDLKRLEVGNYFYTFEDAYQMKVKIHFLVGRNNGEQT